MAIDFDAVLNLGNDYFVSSNFIDAIGIPEDGIRLLMDDRPEVWLTKGSSFSFFWMLKRGMILFQVFCNLISKISLSTLWHL